MNNGASAMAASSTPNGTIIQGFGFGVRSMAQRYLGFVQKQVPDRRSISNKTTLTLTLSRPTGEGTARPVFRSFQSGWICQPTENDSPSPIRWEGAGVRVKGLKLRSCF